VPQDQNDDCTGMDKLRKITIAFYDN